MKRKGLLILVFLILVTAGATYLYRHDFDIFGSHIRLKDIDSPPTDEFKEKISKEIEDGKTPNIAGLQLLNAMYPEETKVHTRTREILFW